jgi:hypothetical protein
METAIDFSPQQIEQIKLRASMQAAHLDVRTLEAKDMWDKDDYEEIRHLKDEFMKSIRAYDAKFNDGYRPWVRQ